MASRSLGSRSSRFSSEKYWPPEDFAIEGSIPAARLDGLSALIWMPASPAIVAGPPDTEAQRAVDTAATAAGFALKHQVICTRFYTMLEYVKAGIGPSVILRSVLPPKPWKDFDAYPLSEPALALTVGIITLRGRYLSPAATALVSAVRDTCHLATVAAER